MKKLVARILAVMLLCTLLIAPAQGTPDTQTKLIALTFDDGPDLDYTPQFLDLLASYEVKATFFLVGKWLPGKRELVQRIAAEGHQIANHTYSHEVLTGKSAAAIIQEVNRTAMALQEIVTQEAYVMRPPFGLRSEASIAAVPAPVILWSLDPAKGKQVSGKRMARSVISAARDGDIILLHDTTEKNLAAVAPIIDALQAKGFVFVTVDELFRLRGIPLENGVAYKRAVKDAPGG